MEKNSWLLLNPEKLIGAARSKSGWAEARSTLSASAGSDTHNSANSIVQIGRQTTRFAIKGS